MLNRTLTKTKAKFCSISWSRHTRTPRASKPSKTPKSQQIRNSSNSCSCWWCAKPTKLTSSSSHSEQCNKIQAKILVSRPTQSKVNFQQGNPNFKSNTHRPRPNLPGNSKSNSQGNSSKSRLNRTRLRNECRLLNLSRSNSSWHGSTTRSIIRNREATARIS